MTINRNIRLSLLALSFLLIVIVTAVSSQSYNGFSREAGISENTWMVSLNGKYLGQSSSEDVMSDFNLSLKRGDVLAIYTVLPDLGDLDFPTLYLQSRYSGFNIYLDGNYYKQYNMVDFRNNRYIGRNNYMISLPKDYAGKILRLEIFTAKDGIRETVTHTTLGEYLDLEALYICKYMAPFLTGSVMIVLGILMILLSSILLPFRREIAFNLYAGALFTTIGVGLHSYYGLTSLYAYIFHETEIFEAMLLLMLPLIMIYLNLLFDFPYKKVYYAILILAFGNFGVRVFLHTRKILYFGFSKEPAILQKISGLPHFERFTMIIVTSASMFLLLSGLYRFFRASTSSIDNTEEYGHLTQVAYEDPLTGLINRGGLSIEFSEYEREGLEYYIIHFDVNNLKRTNDTYGHQTGDKLLKVFATSLDQVFGKSGVCSRQGGDEFTVLLRAKYEETIWALFEKLDRKLEDEARKAGLPTAVGAAYGYAFRANFKTIHEASMAADQHMYECKHRMKKPVTNG